LSERSESSTKATVLILERPFFLEHFTESSELYQQQMTLSVSANISLNKHQIKVHIQETHDDQE
jgi:hypothetical protein